MNALTVDVNPKILEWARDEGGVDITEIASHLKVDKATVEDWEKHGKEIRYTDLRKIAKYYKRQIPVFFLTEVPNKVKKPKDYRNLRIRDKGLHKDTLLAIRRTNRYLSLYKDSVDGSLIQQQYEWLDAIRSSNVDTITYLRDLLDVPVSEQGRPKGTVFKFWRQHIEDKLGIFVFQFPIKNEEFDGFSYIENDKPYAITLNSQIADTRKAFTIFHEIGHIIEGHSGICFTADGNRRPNGLEAKCNHFAAEFLMPEDQIIPPISYSELQRNAEGLGVSPEAYLIRCKTLGVMKEEDAKYKEIMAVIQKKKKEYKNKKKSTGGPAPLVLSKSQRGDKFFDFVVSAYEAQRLSAANVRDILDIKVVGLGRQPKE